MTVENRFTSPHSTGLAHVAVTGIVASVVPPMLGVDAVSESKNSPPSDGVGLTSGNVRSGAGSLATKSRLNAPLTAPFPLKAVEKAVDKATGQSREQAVTLDHDEGPRADTTPEGLAKLKPVFAGGTTTAGNASQLSDGAGAAVMMDADLAAKRGLPILCPVRGIQLASVAPEEMRIASTPAIRKLMKQHGLNNGDVDLWELHEAYAVTTLYNQAQLETPWETTNVNGGAIALGHPYGMSGIRYLGSTLMELGRRGKNKAVVGVCTAGGMATAAYLERV